MVDRLLPNWENGNIETLHEFAKTRLIAMDLDGTSLESSGSQIWQKIPELIRSLGHARYQVVVTLSTGRTLFGISKLLKELSLKKGIPLILYNGSLVVEHGSFEIIYQRKIPPRDLEYIIGLGREYDIDILAYIYKSPRDILLDMESQNEYVMGWSKTQSFTHEFNGMPIRWQDNESIGNSMPSAILINITRIPKQTSDIEKRLCECMDVSFTQSGGTYIEIRPKDSNKGVALKIVAEKRRFLKDEIIAIGDNDNDAEMLAWAGIGVAISDASEAAVAASDYICRKGVVRGVIEVLRVVKEARRYFFQPEMKGTNR
jgi:Cof subfamily protein (haloacid dehalogenase superfamily)